jgi:hypothetical protein
MPIRSAVSDDFAAQLLFCDFFLDCGAAQMIAFVGLFWPPDFLPVLVLRLYVFGFVSVDGGSDELLLSLPSCLRRRSFSASNFATCSSSAAHFCASASNASFNLSMIPKYLLAVSFSILAIFALRFSFAAIKVTYKGLSSPYGNEKLLTKSLIPNKVIYKRYT